MKYLISESQKSKLITFITNSFEKNGFIKTLDIFGITIPVLIGIIGNVKLPKFSCDELYDIISKLIIDNVVITKYITDKYSVYIEEDEFVGSVYFSITKKNTESRLYGYATPFWDGRCYLPIDLEYFTWKDDDGSTYDNEIAFNDRFSPPKNFNTLKDIINWMENDYFQILIGFCEPIFEKLESE